MGSSLSNIHANNPSPESGGMLTDRRAGGGVGMHAVRACAAGCVGVYSQRSCRLRTAVHIICGMSSAAIRACLDLPLLSARSSEDGAL